MPDKKTTLAEIPASELEGAEIVPEDNSLKQPIADIESSGGDYTAINDRGKRPTYALGKYQFVPSYHWNDIKRVTGVKTYSQFLHNPQAQEDFFAWHTEHNLKPAIENIRQYNKDGYSDGQLARLVHFKGPEGARKWLSDHVDDTTENNVSIDRYVGKPEGASTLAEVPASELEGAEIVPDTGSQQSTPATQQPAQNAASPSQSQPLPGVVQSDPITGLPVLPNPTDADQHVAMAKNDMADATKNVAQDIIDNQHQLPPSYTENMNNIPLTNEGNIVHDITDPHGDPSVSAGYLKTRIAQLEKEYTTAQQQEGDPEDVTWAGKGDPMSQAKESDTKLQNLRRLKEGINHIMDLQLANKSQADHNYDPVALGIEKQRLLGDENAAKDQILHNSGRPLDPSAKMNYQIIGLNAMQTAKHASLASGQDAIAEKFGEHSDDMEERIAKDNPEALRLIRIHQIGNQIYKDENWAYGSVFSHPAITQEELQAAAKKLGMSKKDIANIKPEDIPRSAGALNQAVQGFFNTIGAPLYEASMRSLAKRGILDADAVNERFKPGWEEQSGFGKFFVGDTPEAQHDLSVENPKGIVGAMSKGVGDLFGFLVSAEGGKAAFRAANPALTLEQASHMANFATAALPSYNSAYAKSLSVIGDKPEDESKRQLYSLTNGMIGGAIMMMDPKADIARDILGETKAGQDVISMIKNQDLGELTRGDLKSKLAHVIKETTDHLKLQMAMPVAQTAAGNITDMIVDPEHPHGVLDNTASAAASGAIGMFLPSLFSGVLAPHNQTAMAKSVMWEVGKNPRSYKAELSSLYEKGKINWDQFKMSLKNIDNASQIVRGEVPVHSLINGSLLTAQQKQDYAFSLLKTKDLTDKLEAVQASGDKAQIDQVSSMLTAEVKYRTDILNEAGFNAKKNKPVQKEVAEKNSNKSKENVSLTSESSSSLTTKTENDETISRGQQGQSSSEISETIGGQEEADHGQAGSLEGQQAREDRQLTHDGAETKENSGGAEQPPPVPVSGESKEEAPAKKKRRWVSEDEEEAPAKSETASNLKVDDFLSENESGYRAELNEHGDGSVTTGLNIGTKSISGTATPFNKEEIRELNKLKADLELGDISRPEYVAKVQELSKKVLARANKEGAFFDNHLEASQAKKSPEPTPVEHVVEPKFHAVKMGDLDGKPVEEAEPVLRKTGLDEKIGGTGETPRSAIDRIRKAWEKFKATTPDNTLSISHSGVMKIIEAGEKHGWDNHEKIWQDYLDNKDPEAGEIRKYQGKNGDITVTRHAESQDGADGLMRREDTPLTKEGEKEAATEIPAALEKEGVTPSVIVSDDQQRTHHTAEIVQQAVQEHNETGKELVQAKKDADDLREAAEENPENKSLQKASAEADQKVEELGEKHKKTQKKVDKAKEKLPAKGLSHIKTVAQVIDHVIGDFSNPKKRNKDSIAYMLDAIGWKHHSYHLMDLKRGELMEQFTLAMHDEKYLRKLLETATYKDELLPVYESVSKKPESKPEPQKPSGEFQLDAKNPTSISGKKLTPLPKTKLSTPRTAARGLKEWDQWLIENAKNEVKGNSYLETLVAGAKTQAKSGLLTVADRDMLNDILFGNPDGVKINYGESSEPVKKAAKEVKTAPEVVAAANREPVSYEDAIKSQSSVNLEGLPEGDDELSREQRSQTIRDRESAPPSFTHYEIGTYATDKHGELYQLQSIPIDQLAWQYEGTQRESTVNKYASWIKESGTMLPLKGVENFVAHGGKVRVNDGRHRIMAAQQAGLKEVPVWVSLTDPRKTTRPLMATDVEYHRDLQNKKAIIVDPINTDRQQAHTNGVYRDYSGNMYKSTEVKDGSGTTNEHQILSDLQDIPNVVRVGEKVETSHGEAFQIEKLQPLKEGDKISLDEAREVVSTLEKMDERGIYTGEVELGRDADGKLKIFDLSSAEKRTDKMKPEDYSTAESNIGRVKAQMDPEDAKVLGKEFSEKREFDWESFLAEHNNSEPAPKVTDEERELQRRRENYQESKFSKKWAATYDEAVEKIKKTFTDAKEAYNKAVSKVYKKAGPDAKVFVGEELSGKNMSIDQINENRRRRAIQTADAEMKDAIEDLKRLGLTKEEIDQFVKGDSGVKEEPVSPAKEKTVEQRRKDGEYTKDGITYKRNEVQEGPTGKTGKVQFSDGVDEQFEYTLMEADKVQTAHINGSRNPEFFIPEAQPKERTDAGSKVASDKIADNPELDKVGESPNAYSGAPVVNDRGEVIQGNNRAEGLKKHYEQNGKSYKQQLAENAEKFGLTADQVNGMENPVLVRRVKASDEKAIRLGNYDAKDIESGGKRRVDPVATSRRIPNSEKSKMLEAITGGEGEKTLKESVRENFDKVFKVLKKFLSPAQVDGLVGKNGEPTKNGMEDVEALVSHFLFDGGHINLPDFFEQLKHTAKQGLIKALPKIFGVPDSHSLIPEIQNAMVAHQDFANSGVDFNVWKNQRDLFNGGLTPSEVYSPLELKMAEEMANAKTQKHLQEMFAKYAELANGKPGDMFGGGTDPVSKAEAVKQVFNIDNYESEPKQQFPEQPSSEAAGNEVGPDRVEAQNNTEAPAQEPGDEVPAAEEEFNAHEARIKDIDLELQKQRAAQKIEHDKGVAAQKAGDIAAINKHKDNWFKKQDKIEKLEAEKADLQKQMATREREEGISALWNGVADRMEEARVKSKIRAAKRKEGVQQSSILPEIFSKFGEDVEDFIVSKVIDGVRSLKNVHIAIDRAIRGAKERFGSKVDGLSYAEHGKEIAKNLDMYVQPQDSEPVLSISNEEAAKDILADIQAGHMTYADAVGEVMGEEIPDKTKAKILNYLDWHLRDQEIHNKETLREPENGNKYIADYSLTGSGQTSAYLSGKTLSDVHGQEVQFDIDSKETQLQQNVVADTAGLVGLAKHHSGSNDPLVFGADMLRQINDMPDGGENGIKKLMAVTGLNNELHGERIRLETELQNPSTTGDKAEMAKRLQSINKMIAQVELKYRDITSNASNLLNVARANRLFRNTYFHDLYTDKILDEETRAAKEKTEEALTKTEVSDKVAEEGPLREADEAEKAAQHTADQKAAADEKKKEAAKEKAKGKSKGLIDRLKERLKGDKNKDKSERKESITKDAAEKKAKQYLGDATEEDLFNKAKEQTKKPC